jgi:DNA-binding beta-propeller fold protein YncE/cytochrome c553
MKRKSIRPAKAGFPGILLAACCAWPAAAQELSPAAIVSSPRGDQLFIACSSSAEVLVFDKEREKVTDRIPVEPCPTGLALARDGSRLYVTCAAPASTVCVVDVPQCTVREKLPAGHTAMAPVLSPDDGTLYVCNRFDNDVVAYDLRAFRARRISVEREPVAATITPDGKRLLVANHLHPWVADFDRIAAGVSIIDTTAAKVLRNMYLTIGGGLVRGVAVSPDGRFAAVTHLRQMFWFSTTSVDWGRMNCNALTFLDVQNLRELGTVLLDQSYRGAANPWAVTWTPDGKHIAVTHAGSHELSLLNAPVDLNRDNFPSLAISAYGPDSFKVPGPPTHPVRVRKRLPLPGNGPRAIAVAGSELYIANYFSGDLSRVSLSHDEPDIQTLPLGTRSEPTLERRGEMCFNDARLCRGTWQSCASCHDTDGRMDGYNWDLLNDGAGNAKNTKSLVRAHVTWPAMALGVRANAEVAVRAGIHHILFTEQPPEVPQAIDAYLKSLEPVPSPYLVKGKLSAAAGRGQALFMSPRTGCASCHRPPLFTDLAAYDVGTGDEKPGELFDTPALVELWRTAPYLHNGSTVSLRELLTKKNPRDHHGTTSGLSDQEVDDLIAYLLTL